MSENIRKKDRRETAGGAGTMAAPGRKIIKPVVFILVFLLLFEIATRLLQAKWTTGGSSTTSWIEYRSLEEDSINVLYLGTSHVYSGIDPMYIYRNSGITGYALSEGSMRFDLIYLTLKEALKTQSPQLIFLDMSSIRFGEQQDEALAHRFADQLPLSWEKIVYAFTNGNEELTALDVLFPLFRFHSRWDELEALDFQYLSGSLDTTTTRGHYICYDISSTEFHFYEPDGRVSNLTEYGRNYLQKIYDLCEENEIELILYKIPSPTWYLAESEAAADLADELGVTWWELFYEVEEIGLDPQTDYRDKKEHLNQYGAEKVSDYIMRYLQENYELEDQRGTNERWDADLSQYEALLSDGT